MLRYQPRREVAWANRNNFGERLLRDPRRRLVAYAPLVVLHETNYSADSALAWFSLSDLSDEQQASYHAIIRRDGTIIQVVPTEKKAYGAADSAFRLGQQVETIYGAGGIPSVNSFTYHISFETPLDGQDQEPTHSGYTSEQYRSLAWLIALTPVPDERITTHQAVDLSGERMDPRSFDRDALLLPLHYFRQLQAAGNSETSSAPP
jgi:N-acetyl-anhydromuramyl-L-alanine amidase AmpD